MSSLLTKPQIEPLHPPVLEGPDVWKGKARDFFCTGFTYTTLQLSLRRQMEARPSIPEAVWGPDPDRIFFAREFTRLIVDHMAWPKNRFIPDDPVCSRLWTSPQESMGWS
jgi:hypothetical protein